MASVVVPDDIAGAFARSADTARLRALANVQLHATRPASEDELVARVRDAEVIVTFRPAFTRFPSTVLEACPNLRMVCVSGTGVEDVDVATASERNVAVANVAGSGDQAVAELCIALMFDVARRISLLDRNVRAGAWTPAEGIELRGKTLGIVGLSAIARALAPMARGIGMRVLSWSRDNDPTRAAVVGAMASSLDTVLREADVLSLHLRLFPELSGFLNQARIAQMKPGAILINTARGELVDEDALVVALTEGRLRGAGLDVFAHQPLSADHPLRDHPNVVLTPSQGWNTTDAAERMIRQSVDNVVGFLTGTPINVVNAARLRDGVQEAS
jgi:phosphoglycerate dehydrogenase-like enzyme